MNNHGCPRLLPKSAGGLGSSPGCAGKNKVHPDRSPFYVNWAKDFAHFLPDKPSPNNDIIQVPPGASNLNLPIMTEDYQKRIRSSRYRIPL